VNVTADDLLIVGGELLFSIPLYIKIQTLWTGFAGHRFFWSLPAWQTGICAG